MQAPQLFKCLADETRLRVLALLRIGPLCVCHLQEVLDAPQVKMSKHLAYLRKHGLVEASRQGQWVVYRLSGKIDTFTTGVLSALDTLAAREPHRSDRKRLKQTDTSAACCS